MLVLLHGAKKNAGDFLIFDRATRLLADAFPGEEFVKLPRWLPLDEHLETINAARAVVLCGGPGYARDFHPRVFPLTQPLSRIEVPIVPLGLGWSGAPAGNPDAFMFDETSREAIGLLHSRIEQSSVRDRLTLGILRRHGVENVTLTGCPAWYHLPAVGHPFVPPRSIDRVVVTTPARRQNFASAAQLLRELARTFPRAERFLVFHRGIGPLPDEHTTARDALFNYGLATFGRLLRYRIVDASFGIERIQFYGDCDLHVGYRVHAHIDFLSRRKPSILIQEDGRGAGQSLTLGTTDLLAKDLDVARGFRPLLRRHLDAGFGDFAQPIAVMNEMYATMRAFVGAIPASIHS